MIRFIDSEYDDLIKECREYIESKSVIGVDTETTGYDPHSNKVIMFQIGDENSQFVIDTRKVGIEFLRSILEGEDHLKLFHNAKFDWGHIYSSFGIEVSNLHDTMLGEIMLHNGPQYVDKSLSATCERYLGEALAKNTRNEFSSIGDKPFSESQIEYGAKDAEVLSRIYNSQIDHIKKWNMLSEADLENKFIITLSKMEYNGFYMDPDKWRKVVENKRSKLRDVMNRIDQWILDNGPEEYIDRNPTLFSDEPRASTYVKRGKNMKYLFSSQNEAVKFFNKLGIDTKVEDKEKGGYKDSVEESHIKRFRDKCSFIDLYLEYKAIEKSLTTYGDNFLNNINKVTGRVHSNYYPSINTGRLSSSKPNLQNIPSSEDYRSCFTPQYDENTLVVSDYSQQEPRVIAHLSGDERFINFFNTGSGDAHSFVASIISEFSEGKRIDVSKENNPYSKKFKGKIRDIGKMVGLSLNYGKGAYSLKYDLDCTEEEAQKVIDTVQGELKGLKEYFDKVQKETFDRGYILIDKVTGRKFFLQDEIKELRDKAKIINEPDFWEEYRAEREKGSQRFYNELKPLVSKYFSKKGDIERDSLNYPVQGSSASITKYAMILIDREFKKRELSAWIVATIHDEIVVECRRNISEEVRDIMRDKMEGAGETFCPSVKILAEPVITNKWEH